MDPKLGRKGDKLSREGAFCGAKRRKTGGASHSRRLPGAVHAARGGSRCYLPFFFLAAGCATALASPALPDLGSNVTLVVQWA
jgi:hypothetical protein